MELETTLKIVWLCLLVLFAVAEGLTVGLTAIWFAIGAAVSLVAAMLDAPFWAQIVLFFVVSIVCMLLLRPMAKKGLQPKFQPTNADRVVGKEAVVTETVDNLRGQGLVSVGGNVWTARSENDLVLPEGSRVTILRIEGVKVFVRPLEEPERK